MHSSLAQEIGQSGIDDLLLWSILGEYDDKTFDLAFAFVND